MKLKSIDLKKIKIEDSFWSKHVDLVKSSIIPYQWEAMNDRIEDTEPSRCLDNFKIAAGLAQGEFYGVVFQDTDVAKWLEAVAFALASGPDDELEKTADEVIDLIGKAQQADGYLNTYFTIKEPERRWKDLGAGHELYTAGHMMEAAVAYYNATGKGRFLEIMMKNADLICDTFGFEAGKIHGYPGHQEVEIGLIKLYYVTGEKRYLDTAKYFIDARGVGENYFLNEMKQPGYHLIFPDFDRYDPVYSQSHIPVREQTAAEGHAVRAVYMYTAVADLAYEYQDKELMQACEAVWDNIVEKRMYITGGIGSSGILERFTTDYDLPNDYCYCESCASIGLAMFGLRLANITHDAKYVDVIERALYNTVLGGVALDGKSFFYVNPLAVKPETCIDRTSKEHVKPVRQKWFGVACCPPNIARTLASLGQYMYSVSEDQLYVNLFISNKTEVVLQNQSVKVRLETEYPNRNRILLTLTGVPDAGIRAAIRIPDYAADYRIVSADKPVQYRIEKGYAVFSAAADMSVEVQFSAPAKFVRTNPKVGTNNGKVALVRGPQVYCLEEADNGGNLNALYADTKTEPTEKYSEDFGGIAEIWVRGKRVVQEEWPERKLYDANKIKYRKVMMRAIPYSYWNNRGEGEMTVWMNEVN